MKRFQNREAFPYLILQSLNHGYVFQVHGSICENVRTPDKR
jgi:hypothetical protein